MRVIQGAVLSVSVDKVDFGIGKRLVIQKINLSFTIDFVIQIVVRLLVVDKTDF